MSLTFVNGWNKQKPGYAAKFGAYQNELNLLNEPELRTALRIAMMLYKEGITGDMLLAANDKVPGHVDVEQGSHQWEGAKDNYGRQDLENFDEQPDHTLHFTLRYFKAGGGKGLAFHCYLARNTQKQWSVTTISHVEKSVGLEMAQTGSRDFMSMLAKRFVMAHGNDD